MPRDVVVAVGVWLVDVISIQIRHTGGLVAITASSAVEGANGDVEEGSTFRTVAVYYKTFWALRNSFIICCKNCSDDSSIFDFRRNTQGPSSTLDYPSRPRSRKKMDPLIQ
mmetsp:Transcript_36079/g.66128  ORF Transcript_36079/g.66128 Transcript_36079/m.66128 type:complete len:111 (+) Transcript_36079:483-815(+)